MSILPSPLRYGVLVPVKPPAVAKSRLHTLGDEARIALVVAFAVDTIAAAMESPLVDQVLAVTDDHVLASGLTEIGARVIPDGTPGDLNGSLMLAAAELHRRDPGLRLAALCADLPALRSDELTRALSAAPSDRESFVADADGVGTTALLAPSLEEFRPMFGHGSRQAHLDAGAWEIDVVDVPTLRRDVDTREDLIAALALGVGSRTALVATGLRL
jgi:2-phospho-L-lactate/phosphoenolpyruvate guanylyltransferase